MNTPIFDFVKKYAESKTSRMHMPGHKGKGTFGCEQFDITEIDGADVLSVGGGIIGESEANLTSLFATRQSFYSTEGSTLCIKAMLHLVSMGAPKNSVILAARNAHKAFMHGCALLDLDVKWMSSRKNFGISACLLDKNEVEEYLKAQNTPVTAVYITSPDYLGNVADVKGIAEVCHRYGTRLLVDNAHGAYLNFLKENMHPIALGADMCCDSAHKTLPALTGASYLHISKNAEKYVENARDAMALFASTSPSYLTLCSLDLCTKYLAERFKGDLDFTVKRVCELKTKLSELGFTLIGNEPMKITVNTADFGYTGDEVADILRQNGVECEFCDPDFVVLMPSVDSTEADLERVLYAFLSIKRKKAIEKTIPTVPSDIKIAMSIREATFSTKKTVSAEEAFGKICASAAVACPPAIPIAVCGQVIGREQIELFEYYGIKTCRVVDQNE